MASAACSEPLIDESPGMISALCTVLHSSVSTMRQPVPPIEKTLNAVCDGTLLSDVLSEAADLFPKRLQDAWLATANSGFEFIVIDRRHSQLEPFELPEHLLHLLTCQVRCLRFGTSYQDDVICEVLDMICVLRDALCQSKRRLQLEHDRIGVVPIGVSYLLVQEVDGRRCGYDSHPATQGGQPFAGAPFLPRGAQPCFARTGPEEVGAEGQQQDAGAHPSHKVTRISIGSVRHGWPPPNAFTEASSVFSGNAMGACMISAATGPCLRQHGEPAAMEQLAAEQWASAHNLTSLINLEAAE